MASWRLGAGRSRPGESVSAAAGVICHAKPGEHSASAAEQIRGQAAGDHGPFGVKNIDPERTGSVRPVRGSGRGAMVSDGTTGYVPR